MSAYQTKGEPAYNQQSPLNPNQVTVSMSPSAVGFKRNISGNLLLVKRLHAKRAIAFSIFIFVFTVFTVGMMMGLAVMFGFMGMGSQLSGILLSSIGIPSAIIGLAGFGFSLLLLILGLIVFKQDRIECNNTTRTLHYSRGGGFIPSFQAEKTQHKYEDIQDIEVELINNNPHMLNANSGVITLAMNCVLVMVLKSGQRITIVGKPLNQREGEQLASIIKEEILSV